MGKWGSALSMWRTKPLYSEKAKHITKTKLAILLHIVGFGSLFIHFYLNCFYLFIFIYFICTFFSLFTAPFFSPFSISTRSNCPPHRCMLLLVLGKRGCSCVSRRRASRRCVSGLTRAARGGSGNRRPTLSPGWYSSTHSPKDTYRRLYSAKFWATPSCVDRAICSFQE